MTRNEIKQRIKENFFEIKSLEQENIELTKQAILLSDDEQQFIEQIESHPKSKYQRKDNYLDGKLVGRIHWVEEFKDESTALTLAILNPWITLVFGWLIYSMFVR